jgi:hypothetical protein
MFMRTKRTSVRSQPKPGTLASLTNDGELRALLVRRSEDLSSGRLFNIQTTYAGDIDKYVRTFRAFVLAEWETVCREKAQLNLTGHSAKLVPDDSDLILSSLFLKLPKEEKRMIEFVVPSAHIRPSFSELSTSSDSTILVGDRVRISYGEYDEQLAVEGRIISICDQEVSVSVKFKSNMARPASGRWNTFRCDIEFFPCDAIVVRQLLALDVLAHRPQSDSIRRIVLGQARSAPGQLIPFADASYSFENVTFRATQKQTEAVRRALSQPFTIIQGPPGTGKTKTISAIVIQLLANPEIYGTKVLVCGTSNASVQNLAVALLPAVRGAGKHLVWLAAATRDIQPSPDLPPEFEALAYWQMLKDPSPQGMEYLQLQQDAWKRPLRGSVAEQANLLREQLEKQLCLAADVVCCTLETAARDCMVGLIFKSVIMDEATQAVEPSALIPLIYKAERVVLVGDQCQLGPVVRTRDLESHGYDWSLFERMIESKADYVMLDQQFRMHPEISAFPNKQFYDNKIQDGVTAEQRMGPRLTCFPNPKIPILFIHSSGDEQKIGRSFANEVEANITARVVTTLTRGGIKSCQIGIITPYRPQVQLLEQTIRPNPSMHPDMKIATVDSFQGGECDYIVMSCVRTGPTIGFVKDTRRMNVSLTRARYGLVIIGDRDSLSRDSPDWNALCSHFAAKRAIIKEDARVAPRARSDFGKR